MLVENTPLEELEVIAYPLETMDVMLTNRERGTTHISMTLILVHPKDLEGLIEKRHGNYFLENPVYLNIENSKRRGINLRAVTIPNQGLNETDFNELRRIVELNRLYIQFYSAQ